MKIIISRKGFDSAAGGVPSAIMPDGRLIPFPIPSSNDPSIYSDVTIGGVAIGELVEALTAGKISRTQSCHLDPDLDESSLKRLDGWRPSLGQIRAAQGHLANHKVEAGDLFFFFGWFRRIEKSAKGWRYEPQSRGLHVLYGWLQIGQIIRLGHGERPSPIEAFSNHPHLHNRHHISNTLYLAKDRLEIEGINAAGAGLFGHITNKRTLTNCQQSKCSIWTLPAWMHPGHGSTLTYHLNPERWDLINDQCALQSVAKGQEFVLTARNAEDVRGWLNEIFAE